MTTIDTILLIFIGLFAILGFIRGVISQAMAIVGLVAAYFFAAPLSVYAVDRIAQAMGSSQSYAKPFAVLWASILIYIGCRLIGFVFEKFFINQSQSLKGLNRIGGGFLGAVKGCIILLIAFYILRLVPHETLMAHAPKINQSKMYQFFTNNQFLDPKYIETLAEPVTKPAQKMFQKGIAELPKSITESMNKKALEKTESDMNEPELKKILSEHSEPGKTPVPKKK